MVAVNKRLFRKKGYFVLWILFVILSLMRTLLMKKALLVVLIVLALHLLASDFGWYSRIFGFDKVQHTLGGVFLGLIAGVLLEKWIFHATARRTVGTLLLFVFVVGFGWEIFEYVVQYLLPSIHLADPVDSLGDIMFDLVGGCIASYLVIRAQSQYTVGNGTNSSAASSSRK